MATDPADSSHATLNDTGSMSPGAVHVETLTGPDPAGNPEEATARRAQTAARIAFGVLLVLSLGSLLLTGVLAYRHWSYKRQVTESSKSELVSLTSKAAASIDVLVRDTASVADSIASDLTAGTSRGQGSPSESRQPWRVPIFLAALLLARGLPALLYRPIVGPRRVLPAALLQATSLPFIVATTTIGVELQVLAVTNASALVAAGLLSVIIFPMAAMALLRADAPASPSACS